MQIAPQLIVWFLTHSALQPHHWDLVWFELKQVTFHTCICIVSKKITLFLKLCAVSDFYHFFWPLFYDVFWDYGKVWNMYIPLRMEHSSFLLFLCWLVDSLCVHYHQIEEASQKGLRDTLIYGSKNK